MEEDSHAKIWRMGVHRLGAAGTQVRRWDKPFMFQMRTEASVCAYEQRGREPVG